VADLMEWLTRSGIGYDIHRLVPGRRLVLGGVQLEHALGLDGHSDADVVSHAIGDALLGAVGLGDLGQHFPPGDPATRDISSLELLRRIAALVRGAGAEIVHVDATVIAEAPRLGPQVGAMSAALATALGLDPARVSVKAKTNEGLDAIGRGEAIAAHAVATVRQPA
jgi:2-C-methyl-D-erythritol 2,4-cyclodiphosphate synthase